MRPNRHPQAWCQTTTAKPVKSVSRKNFLDGLRLSLRSIAISYLCGKQGQSTTPSKRRTSPSRSSYSRITLPCRLSRGVSESGSPLCGSTSNCLLSWGFRTCRKLPGKVLTAHANTYAISLCHLSESRKSPPGKTSLNAGNSGHSSPDTYRDAVRSTD